MTEENEPFRFLTDAEFLALSMGESTRYLSRAAQELEARQQLLREQLDILRKEAEN